LYADYLHSLVVVRNGIFNRPQAAWDLDSFLAMADPSENSPSLGALRTAGKLFEIAPGTNGRTLTEESKYACGATRIRLLDDLRNNEIVWMCGENLQRKMPVVP